MSICLICPFSKPDVGGVENHIEKLTKHLTLKKKQQVTLITYMPLTSKKFALKYEKKTNFEVYRMPWFGKGWFRILEKFFPLNVFYLFPGLFIKSFLVLWNKHKTINVIHAHGVIAGLIVLLLNPLFKKRIFISTHAVYSVKPKTFKAYLFKFLLNPYEKVFAVGQPSLDEIVQVGIPKSRVTIHDNWIDLNWFRPHDQKISREKLGFPEDPFLVLFVGRMIEIKGELVLLEAAKLCQEEILFVFVGDGPTAPRIAKEAKTNKNILYFSNVLDEKMPLFYSSANLFASPVLYEEGYATVYLEAIACGVPILSASRGCLPYFLSPDVATFIKEVTPAKVLKRILVKNKDKNNILERIACRTYAENRFSTANADRLFESYTK